MEDEKIIELFWQRNEEAIRETSSKYVGLCFSIAKNILSSPEDSEECVNDTYYSLWRVIPTERPLFFAAFIGKITRNLALKKFAYFTAQKRNPEAICSFDELSELLSGQDTPESQWENRRIESDWLTSNSTNAANWQEGTVYVKYLSQITNEGQSSGKTIILNEADSANI